MSTLNELHPLPWQVKYRQRFEKWHPKSRPYIVDANHAIVVEMNCHVGHPGDYDAHADGTAQAIVNAVNTQYKHLSQQKRFLAAAASAQFADKLEEFVKTKEAGRALLAEKLAARGYTNISDVLPEDYESILHELESESNGSL